jgi:hypothetical protein
MPRFVIEREMPGAGKLTAEDLRGAAQKSCSVLKEMGPTIQWDHTYVADDKLYCVYIAENETQIRQHAERGGFPVSRISRIGTMIDPTTAE